MRLPQFHAHSQLACDSAGALEIRQLVASLEVAEVPSPKSGPQLRLVSTSGRHLGTSTH